jgi:hypothetical protein
MADLGGCRVTDLLDIFTDRLPGPIDGFVLDHQRGFFCARLFLRLLVSGRRGSHTDFTGSAGQ